MDALKMAAVVSADVSRPIEPATTQEFRTERLPPRMRSALAALAEARQYAGELSADAWEFAVEIGTLRRLKLSNSDLRWLAVSGLIDHAVEVTLAGDGQRSFRRPARLMFSKRTCFVLSDAGQSAARELGAPVERRGRMAEPREPRVLGLVPAPVAFKPHWDRDLQELRVGSAMVKQFKIPSRSEEAILAAFEEKGWPPRIDDPLAGYGGTTEAAELEAAIERLNRQQKNRLIRFALEAAGKQVVWELCGDVPGDT